jgi:hypothetical protein
MLYMKCRTAAQIQVQNTWVIIYITAQFIQKIIRWEARNRTKSGMSE